MSKLTKEEFWKLACLLGNAAIAGKLNKDSSTFNYVWEVVNLGPNMVGPTLIKAIHKPEGKDGN